MDPDPVPDRTPDSPFFVIDFQDAKKIKNYERFTCFYEITYLKNPQVNLFRGSFAAILTLKKRYNLSPLSP
jgi:hypothetical protein